MGTSVFDWMLAQKRVSCAKDEAVSKNEDVLVRILKSLDAEASKTAILST